MPNKSIPNPFEAIKQNNMAAFKAWLETQAEILMLKTKIVIVWLK